MRDGHSYFTFSVVCQLPHICQLPQRHGEAVLMTRSRPTLPMPGMLDALACCAERPGRHSLVFQSLGVWPPDVCDKHSGCSPLHEHTRRARVVGECVCSCVDRASPNGSASANRAAIASKLCTRLVEQVVQAVWAAVMRGGGFRARASDGPCVASVLARPRASKIHYAPLIEPPLLLMLGS
eukprot:364277-Chlamydomonas_euryale.AAC.20